MPLKIVVLRRILDIYKKIKQMRLIKKIIITIKKIKRKIIWFNHPFCKLANIDVGKYFLRLLDNCELNNFN